MWMRPCAWLRCRAPVLAGELRWILAAICVPLLLAIWWWGTRRSRQAPGNAELRESMLVSAAPERKPPPFDDASADPPDPGVRPQTPHPQGPSASLASRDWGVSPFEPLSIRTADFEQVQIVDLPMTAHPDSLEETLDLGRGTAVMGSGERPTGRAAADDAEPMSARPPDLASAPQPPRTAAPIAEGVGTGPRTSAPIDPAATGSNVQAPNVSETQRIVSVRVCAAGDARWPGTQLMAALENHGLAHGRYQVFHRRHSDGRTLFCAASLVEPGTFNLARMPEEEFRGLTLFAVLPGPAEPLQTLEALIQTAVEIAQSMNGVVQDSKGVPLSQQGAELLREDVARFQAMLTMS